MKYLTIPPKYELTKNIAQLLAQIEANKAVIDYIDCPKLILENLQTEATRKIAHYSCRIENDEKKKWATSGLEKAVKLLPEVQISKRGLLKLHKTAGLSGEFRTENEGVFDSFGVAVYIAPSPDEVHKLISNLLNYIAETDEIVPIKAAIAHLIFEKIHPFVDGNGRIGRLLQQAVLTSNGYGMKGLVIVEEEIDNNRQSYYRAIEDSVGENCQPFVELMLEFLKDSSEKAKINLQQKINNSSRLDLLLPRHQELVQIINEQKTVSFVFLHRRFLKISPRQLAYDLTFLIKNGFISRLGSTRGAMYTPKENR